MTVRRWAGAGLLVLAVVGSLVIAGLNGVRVAGTPMAPPGLSAPSVGDCLVALSDQSIAVPPAGRPSSQPVTGVSENAVRFADCGSTAQIGEVVGYQQYPQQSPTGDTDVQWCQRVSDDYRAHQSYRYRDSTAGLWEPSTGQRFLAVLSRPNDDQLEPRWAACVLLAPNVERYAGSFLRSLADAPAPKPFGLCLAGTFADRWVSCAVGHRTQEFGMGTGAAMTARAAIDGCRSLVSRMTALPDITAGGLLRLEVVGGSSDGAGGQTADGTLDAGTSSAGSASCRLSIVGTEQLVGTLIGVGDGALPIS